MNTGAASDPLRDRFRPASQPLSGNEEVPATSGPKCAVTSALAYARRGWPVFPCRPGTKEPATQHGFRDASMDPAQIRSWWERWPDANVAIATGTPGPDVLDVDQHGRAGNGYPALMRLKREGMLEASGVVVRTPHGGLHLYFTGSAQSSGRLPHHHLDFKSAGGYVLAPPSEVERRPYRPLRQAVASGGISWARVTTLLEPQAERSTANFKVQRGDVGALAAWVERLRAGNRNAGLFWAACRAVEVGQPGWLDQIATAAAKTGLSEQEISRTIDSARRGGQRMIDRQFDREATR
jgi:hypothetical protein